MSELELGERHDPHFLAQVNSLFDQHLIGREVDHWYTVTPAVAPGPAGPDGYPRPIMVMNVCIFRKGFGKGSVLATSVPVAKFLTLLNPGTIEALCASLCGELATKFHEGLLGGPSGR